MWSRAAFHDVIPHRDEELANPVFYPPATSSTSRRARAWSTSSPWTARTGQCYRVTTSQFGANLSQHFSRWHEADLQRLHGQRLQRGRTAARSYNLDARRFRGALQPDIPAANRTTTARKFRRRPVPCRALPSGAASLRRPFVGLHFRTTGSRVSASFPTTRWGCSSSQASFLYNTDEGTPGFETSFHYNRFFPVLDFSIADRERKIQYVGFSDQFSERTATAGFHIPLNLSRGFYNSGLSVGANAENIDLKGGSLTPLNYGIGIGTPAAAQRARPGSEVGPDSSLRLQPDAARRSLHGQSALRRRALRSSRPGAPSRAGAGRRLRARQRQLHLFAPDRLPARLYRDHRSEPDQVFRQLQAASVLSGLVDRTTALHQACSGECVLRLRQGRGSALPFHRPGSGLRRQSISLPRHSGWHPRGVSLWTIAMPG